MTPIDVNQLHATGLHPDELDELVPKGQPGRQAANPEIIALNAADPRTAGIWLATPNRPDLDDPHGDSYAAIYDADGGEQASTRSTDNPIQILPDTAWIRLVGDAEVFYDEPVDLATVVKLTEAAAEELELEKGDQPVDVVLAALEAYDGSSRAVSALRAKLLPAE